jgi:hypothetical protein
MMRCIVSPPLTGAAIQSAAEDRGLSELGHNALCLSQMLDGEGVLLG